MNITRRRVLHSNPIWGRLKERSGSKQHESIDAYFAEQSPPPLAAWAGFVYVAFVVDTSSRRINGWSASATA